MMTKIEWNKVYEELIKVSMFAGKYDRRNANWHFINGITTVMEYVAKQAERFDDYVKLQERNKAREYCPDPANEFDCPYLDPATRECTIGNQKEECADFEWDEEEEEEEEEE